MRARTNESNFASRTYVVHQTGQVVGYYALSAGEVTRTLAPGSIRRNMPDPVPSILLGRLAVDERLQGRGLGRSLLFDAIQRMIEVAAQVGVRVAVVDAISDDGRHFYAHHGFIETLNDPSRLVLDLRTVNPAAT